MYTRVLVISDNEYLLNQFRPLAERLTEHAHSVDFTYTCSPNNTTLLSRYEGKDMIRPLQVKTETAYIIQHFDLVISLHCKQLFPPELVRAVRCINVHPGLNPYNRGWFPQVFSILNQLPAGATIHEIDEQLDHGPVICQKQVKLESYDTSFSAYNKILQAELELLEENLIPILENRYTRTVMPEGNVNLKADFDQLCELDMGHTDTLQNHLNLLRALTHGDYANAFFIDENGRKVFVKVELNIEQNP